MVARLRAPGLYRAFFGLALGIAFAAGSTWLVRMATGHTTYHHFLNEEAVMAVIAAVRPDLLPLRPRRFRLLALLGRRAAHPPRGSLRARGLQLEGLLPHQHRPQGDRHSVHRSPLSSSCSSGGLMAMLMRAQLAQPGAQFVSANTYNGLFSVHASLLIFLFVIPVFAGFANYVLPIMIGAPDMAFPRLNALSYWLLPLAGAMMLSSFAGPRRRLRRRLDRLRPALDRRADRTGLLLRSACSSRGPPRSRRRSTSW